MLFSYFKSNRAEFSHPIRLQKGLIHILCVNSVSIGDYIVF